MKAYKLAIASCLVCSLMATQAFAADPVAKEETTPPIAEGPLPADSIPPINPEPAAPPVAAPKPASVPLATPPATPSSMPIPTE